MFRIGRCIITRIVAMDVEMGKLFVDGTSRGTDGFVFRVSFRGAVGSSGFCSATGCSTASRALWIPFGLHM